MRIFRQRAFERHDCAKHRLDSGEPRMGEQLSQRSNDRRCAHEFVRAGKNRVRPDDIVDALEQDKMCEARKSEDVAIEPLEGEVSAPAMQKPITAYPLIENGDLTLVAN